MMAGEWLERAGLPRGRADADQPIEHLEGAPAWAQPKKLPDDVNLVIEHKELREEPRPQALTGNI